MRNAGGLAFKATKALADTDRRVAENFQRLANQLDAPTGANPDLQRLLAIKARWTKA